MSKKKPRTWFDRAVDTPMTVFPTPAAVLRDERLDEAGMRAVLEAWKQAKRAKEREDEIGPELRDVLGALAELDRRTGRRGMDSR